MEAHHFGLQLLDQIAHRGIERRAIGGVDRRRRVETQLLIVRRKPPLPRKAAQALRRPRSIWSASVPIRSTISAALGMSWISPTASPAITAATSKLPAALAAAYSAATVLTFCKSSSSRPVQRRA